MLSLKSTIIWIVNQCWHSGRWIIYYRINLYAAPFHKEYKNATHYPIILIIRQAIFLSAIYCFLRYNFWPNNYYRSTHSSKFLQTIRVHPVLYFHSISAPFGLSFKKNTNKTEYQEFFVRHEIKKGGSFTSSLNIVRICFVRDEGELIPISLLLWPVLKMTSRLIYIKTHWHI